ncbi:MAG: class I SAM-dependent methyltransferase [Patescibacteria group bacterium]|jgi:ubiquinone/menaquinone biosynthesis C-methylase UbiE
MNREKPTGNIYETKIELKDELERLKNTDFTHPLYASAKTLESIDLADKKVLDVGSGPDQKMGSLVENRGGKYIALDYNASHLQTMKRSAEEKDLDIFFVRGDVKNLPIKEGSVDFAHERFVLMHLSPEDRKKAIKEIVATAKDTAFFLEYNWESLLSETHPEIINEFKKLAMEIMAKLKIQPYMGKLLETEVVTALSDTDEKYSTTNEIFERNGKFGKEISAMIKSLIEVADKLLKDNDLKNKLIILEQKILASTGEMEIIPPDINAVSVKKLSN